MLTSKQRSYLRGLANPIQPIFQIGKGGISDAFIKQIEEALEAREFIKVTVLKNAELSSKEYCQNLAELTQAQPVLAIGNRLVLYKQSQKHQTIFLD